MKPSKLRPHGSVLDAETDSLSDADWQCFEMEELMHSKALALPVLTYLFHKLEARFDGKPTLLVLDEAWVFLDDPVFSALIESCPSRIFLPNGRATEPQQLEAYRRFGLNDTQVQLIAHATPKRDYYFQSRAGNRVFDFLSICGASSVADIEAASRIHDSSVFPDFANEWLIRRELEWAADLLATHPEFSTSKTGAA